MRTPLQFKPGQRVWAIRTYGVGRVYRRGVIGFGEHYEFEPGRWCNVYVVELEGFTRPEKFYEWNIVDYYEVDEKLTHAFVSYGSSDGL